MADHLPDPDRNGFVGLSRPSWQRRGRGREPPLAPRSSSSHLCPAAVDNRRPAPDYDNHRERSRPTTAATVVPATTLPPSRRHSTVGTSNN